MKNKSFFDKIIVVDIIILALSLLFSYTFHNNPVESVIQMCLIEILVLANVSLGIADLLKSKPRRWQAVVLLTLYFLQIVICVYDILWKSYRSTALCVMAIATMLLQDKMLAHGNKAHYEKLFPDASRQETAFRVAERKRSILFHVIP